MLNLEGVSLHSFAVDFLKDTCCFSLIYRLSFIWL